jgi:hypothetical protein
MYTVNLYTETVFIFAVYIGVRAVGNYRLNMQIGSMLQNILFPDESSALGALAALAQAKASGSIFLGFPTSNAIVDPTKVSFAFVRKNHDR